MTENDPKNTSIEGEKERMEETNPTPESVHEASGVTLEDSRTTGPSQVNLDKLTMEGQNMDGEPGMRKEEEKQKPREPEQQKEKLKETAEERPPETQHDQEPKPEQNPIQAQNRLENEQPDQYSSQVQELLAIFPQIQPSILEDVLAAHGNEVSACISDLLAISDPTYKPSEQESMAQLDAELARQLTLQETQQQQATRPAINEQEQLSYLPYQPRIKRTTPPNRSFVRQVSPAQAQSDQASGTSDGKDEIQKIADEIGKLAETGKKTMSLWLEKAKSKIQEIQLPTPPLSQSEHLAGDYEHAERPSSSSTSTFSNSFNSPNSSAMAATAKNPRITPALPHASRYSNANRTPTTVQPSARSLGRPPSSTQLHPSPDNSKVIPEGYHVEESNSTTKDAQTLGSATVGHSSFDKIPSATLPPNQHHQHQSKVRDDDEESLEYTRNVRPFKHTLLKA
ncbi:uncharacterized protein VP01_2828g4 [Puccinia sorghi]|uniref:CUE domain-containing protein n=1 Tax=Puccinia sorghi TaxID=27349 RepID=A0A0L6V422_9BASI|nr:uncharacterized protein VP01_2828g4 [Puccinia sorghi]